MNNFSDLQVTKLDELRGYAKGQIVELPPFAEGQPFVVRLTRPSLLVMVKDGRIPNTLLTTANKLFMGSSSGFDTDDTKMLDDMYGVMEEMCYAAFVEPTYKEILNTGVRLTDEQLMAVFNYCQKGVAALQPFRTKPGNTVPNRAGKGISKAPFRNTRGG